MKKLKIFNELGLCITWKLIDLGFKGSEVFQGELSTKEIIDFAVSIMEKGQNADADVINLACEYEANADGVDKYVKQLAQKENTEYCFEYRKWRVLYVLHNLPAPETEFIEGLIALGDIWVKLNFPSDSPHVFQGRYNNIAPEQYYTQGNYNNLFRRHVEWINTEMSQIKGTSLA